MEKSIVILAEHENGVLSPQTFEAAALAEKLGSHAADRIILALLGAEVEAAAEAGAEALGYDVLALENHNLLNYNSELYISILAEYFDNLGAAYLLLPHTTASLDFGPGLAVRLNAAWIPGVEGVESDGEKPVFQRAAYNGKIILSVRSEAEAAVLTFQPGIFKDWVRPNQGPGRATLVRSEAAPVRSRTLEFFQARSQGASLAEADVIVAAVRGVGKRENLELIERTAALFSRSVTAGSRPICDLGWMEYQRQVGMTGAVVSPKLYLACGISGARQHTVGMQGSGFIVAVSTDPGAAIFNLADVCVVEDLTRFLPVFIEEVTGEKG